MNCLAKEAAFQRHFFGDMPSVPAKQRYAKLEALRKKVLAECDDSFEEFLLSANVLLTDASPEITGIVGRLQVTFTWHLPEAEETSFGNLVEMRLRVRGGLCLPDATYRIVVSLDCLNCPPEKIDAEWVRYICFRAFSEGGDLLAEKRSPDFRGFLEELFSGCDLV